MGRRLPDEVVYRIRVRIEAGEGVPAIAKAIDVARRTVYKIRVNLDLYGEPYAPASVVYGRPRLLLAYQELVSLRLLDHLSVILGIRLPASSSVASSSGRAKS